MKIYSDINDIPIIKNPVLTIGTFDGVHLGHQKIIERLNDIANEIDGESVIVTFEPHPRLILFPFGDLKLLTTLDEKIDLLKKFHVNHLIVVPFTFDFANQHPADYIKNFLVEKIHLKKLIIGYDHRFGKNREGNIESHHKLCNLYNYSVEEISKQIVEEVAVSSTKIRNFLHEGNIEMSNHLLGYFYSITGEVVQGKKIGFELGFPTANIQVKEKLKLIPANGVYAVRVLCKEKIHKGMLNIGFNPTFNETNHTIEVNMFDFNENIYGEKITVEFIAFLRKEEKFNSVEELKKQLHRDRDRSLELLSSKII